MALGHVLMFLRFTYALPRWVTLGAMFLPTSGKVDDLLAEAKKRLQYKPGSSQVYPVERIGGKAKTERIVTSYVQNVYGEKEGGGTQVLYLSHVPFDKIGLPDYGAESVPSTQRTLQHGIYQGFVAPVALLGALSVVTWRNRKSASSEEEER